MVFDKLPLGQSIESRIIHKPITSFEIHLIKIRNLVFTEIYCVYGLLFKTFVNLKMFSFSVKILLILIYSYVTNCVKTYLYIDLELLSN